MARGMPSRGSTSRTAFIFNLLDLQSLPSARLEDHLAAVPLLRDIGARLLGLDIPALAAWLLAELTRAGAIEVRNGIVRPMMAA
jgi:hypothetical protein